MHHWKGVRRITGLICAVLFLLCSCGRSSPEQRIEAVRNLYGSAEGITATAELTADYGERVYSYTVSIEGSAKNGSMTVKAPENIAGMTLCWNGEDTALEYEGIALETGSLTAGGLSPAEAVPVILSACASGELVQYTGGGEASLEAELRSPMDDSVLISCIFQPESLFLQQAELRDQERRVLTITFQQFQLEPTKYD